MEVKFTKSSPKIQDYNPITHTPFYANPSERSSLSPPKLPNGFSSPQRESPFKSTQRPTYIAGKNILPSPLNQKTSRSIDFINKTQLEIPKFSKLNGKNTIVDPISGEVRVYNINRPRLQYLDSDLRKDRANTQFNLDYCGDFKKKEQEKMLKPNDNISGSLKKPVQLVPYVNQYALKSVFN